MLRTTLEYLSRSIVFKRRLSPLFNNAPLYVSPGSALGYWRFDITKINQTLVNVASQHLYRGQVVWDIGANVGLFTFAAANLVNPGGTVLCIEPDRWLVNLLMKSSRIKGNREFHINILPLAITDKVGIVELNIAKRGRSCNFISGSLGSSQTGGVRNTQLVPSVNLDWLLDRYPAPDFIKIDVEGAELNVLRGATRLLAEIKPVIFCEVASECAGAIADLLHGYGYVIYDAKRQARVPSLHAPWDTLAYPAEQV